MAGRRCGIGKIRDGGILRPVCATGRDGDERKRDGAPGPSLLFDSVASPRTIDLDTLAARIARDFANLLAPVLGGITLVGEEIPPTHPLRERLDGIRQAAAAARAFAQRVAMLDPSRGVTVHRAEIKVLVREWLSPLRAQLRADITLDCPPVGIPDIVRVDRHQLEHAMVELALNAQDAMPGGGTLYVDATSVEGEGGPGKLPVGRWVRVRIRDTGCGMEERTLAHAFEPFVTAKVPGSGAGLGLPVVAAIVRQHGGLVALSSRLGHGTTVSLFLPCHITQTHPRDLTPPMGVPLTPVVGNGPAVLVVEDNAMVRRSIEVTLRGAGYRVTSVDGGERCLESVARSDEPLDLLITDVIMPEMSGEELIRRVRDLRPALPVLFISGYDRSSLARRRETGAAESFLQKPFDSEDLFAAVRAVLAKRSGE
jgi:two-component system cell cycle sensor histidine kinase/response regulator CckA